jgi:hypothetical protein
VLSKRTTARLQVEQGEGFRSSKFDVTRHAMTSLASEIALLDARKHELMEELRKVRRAVQK